MEKADLLKQVGFSEEFIKKLEDFQNNIVDFPIGDFAEESIIQTGFDTDTLRIETSQTNSDNDIRFKTK